MSRILVRRYLLAYNSSRLLEPRVLPAMERSYRSSLQCFSVPTSGSSGGNGGGELPQSVQAHGIERYWNDVCLFDHEPGFFLFGSKAKGYDPNDVVKDTSFVRRLISETIFSENKDGDTSPTVLARNCCEFYESLNKENRERFLDILGRQFDVPREESINASHHYMDETKDMKGATVALFRAEQLLRHALTPPYGKFFDRINKLPGGIKFLVDLRADLDHSSNEDPSNVYFPEMSQTLKEKLQNWFMGSLSLERITWDSSAATLEKIRNYERVHAIADWRDLKRRVGAGRRCYGFFHRSIPNEPLVFVQVALVNGISDSIQDILDNNKQSHQHNPYAKADSAIFYSITTQKGLSGVELGSFLIKRVVSELRQELAHIETFCTLSPIPGLRQWLETNLRSPKTVLLSDELHLLKSIGVDVSDTAQLYEEILRSSDWSKIPALADAVKNPLLRWCARYILHEKRNDMAIDPVANFHLRNGACMHRINWLGDTSEKGIKQSFGMMANYNYVLESIQSNSREYLRSGSIAVSSDDPTLLGSKVTRVDA